VKEYFALNSKIKMNYFHLKNEEKSVSTLNWAFIDLLWDKRSIGPEDAWWRIRWVHF
jgi:hypothetical protein